MHTMNAQVEIIANTNLGTHTIAALKGDFTLGPAEQREGVGPCRTVNEVYESTKYQGALLTSKILKRECVLTYLGDQVAVKRGTGGQGGGVFIYKRLSQADASKDIQVCYVRALMIYMCTCDSVLRGRMSSIVIPCRSFIQIHLHDMRRHHRVEREALDRTYQRSRTITGVDGESSAWSGDGEAAVGTEWCGRAQR